MVITKCDQCRQTYAERTPPEVPDCTICWVDLMQENQEAVRVYMMTQKQIITAGMGQVVDISIPAVKIVMDLFGVRDQKKCLSKVRAVFHYFLGKKES